MSVTTKGPDTVWIFTTAGFLSVVTDGQRPGNLLVRARARKDIETFAAAAEAPAPLETPNRDYR